MSIIVLNNFEHYFLPLRRQRQLFVTNQSVSKGDYVRVRAKAVKHLPAVNPSILLQANVIQKRITKKVIVTIHFLRKKMIFC